MRVHGPKSFQHQASCSSKRHISLTRCFASSSRQSSRCARRGSSHTGSSNCTLNSSSAHRRHLASASHTRSVGQSSVLLVTEDLGQNPSSADCTSDRVHLGATTRALSVFLASTILLLTPYPHSASAAGGGERLVSSDSSPVTQQHAPAEHTAALNTAPPNHFITETASPQTSVGKLDPPSATTAAGMTHSATAMEMRHTAAEVEVTRSAMGMDMSHAVAAPGTSAALFHCTPLSGEERLDAYGPVDRYSQRWGPDLGVLTSLIQMKDPWS